MASPPNPWFSWDYIQRNWDAIWEQLVIHASLTVETILIAFVIAFPLAVLARRVRWLSRPILGVSGVLYTVPSLALFAILAPFTGIGRTTVLIGLVAYALLVLVRNIVVGLEGVDRDVVDAARGVGYGPNRLLLGVEVPNALPSIVAGLRLATVSTVALVTVGVVVGYGGLGQLMFLGFRSNYRAEIATASVLCVALALALDMLIVLGARLAMPWARGRRP
jgi:osmoprotectant transport system permease protein